MIKRINSIRVLAAVCVLAAMTASSIASALVWYLASRLGLAEHLHLFPLVMLGVSVLLGTILAAAFSRRLLQPLNKLIEATKAVSQGDFTVRVEESEKEGEIAELMRCFNQMCEELEGTELLRSDFINTFSHEFKTPLGSIRGFAKRLARSELSEAKRVEYAELILAQSDRLANMSSNILLLNKYEHQQMVADRVRYRLDEQLRRCILLLERQWTRKQIEFDVDLPEIQCLANEEMLEHVWTNILDNAVKFTGEGGRITVRAAERSDRIMVEIADTGPGMDGETLNHIFDKFYQHDPARSEAGNGLGLSLVRRIVELCAGDIQVESQVGRGTTFRVVLPRE